MEDHNASPFNALPPVVVALAVVLFGLEVMFQAATMGLLGGPGGVGWRLAAIRDYAVFNEVAAVMWAQGIYTPELLARFITYPLIHGGFMHMLLVVAFVLALGKMVAEVFSPWAFLVIFWVSAICGALGFVTFLDSPYPLIGGYPGVYGLIGGFTYILWLQAEAMNTNRSRAFALIGVLLAVQLLFGFVNGEFGTVVADLSGFAAGFCLSFVVSPGGWRRLLARLRDR